nr:ubiquinone/menaquinone biosynthesis methyltransferase [Desulfatiglans anilini]
MFSEISARYDLMNRLMTFDRDRNWKREVIRRARLQSGHRLLDVGTGTGGIAFEAQKSCREVTITAVDFTRPMLEIGRARDRKNTISWCQADALRLPFEDAAFDAVTSGYLIRNVPDPLRAFEEQMRVLKPGGRVVCLDTSPPPPGPLAPFVRFYLRRVIPFLGEIIAGNRSAYTYLPETTQAFFEPARLAALMREAGFERVSYRQFMFHTITVHTGERPLTR